MAITINGTNGLTTDNGALKLDTDTLVVDDTNNRVGIGTSSPIARFEVSTSEAADLRIMLTNDSNLNEIRSTQSDQTSYTTLRYDALEHIYEVSDTEVMRIKSNGRVGIGTTSPSGMLHLSGALPRIYFTDTDTATVSTFSGENGWLTLSAATSRMTFSIAGSEKMRIDGNGNLLVGTTSGSSRFALIGAASQSAGLVQVGTNGYPAFDFRNSAGTQQGYIQVNASNVAYTSVSDYRLKENVVEITDGIDRVKLLNPSRFNFIADSDTTVDGFLAHEVQEVVPEAITGAKDATKEEEYEVTPAVLDDDGNVVTEAVMGTRTVPDYQGIDQSKLVPLLTAALQEAITKIETLEARVTALENA